MNQKTTYPNLIIVGAGNVATRMAIALSDHANIMQIMSRHIESAQKLADQVGARAVDSIDQLEIGNADGIILAITDGSIPTVVNNLNMTFGDILHHTDSPIVVHTSGSVPLSVFPSAMKRYGVFYPLQTLSRDIVINFQSVPLFTEADSEATEAVLTQWALLITQQVNHLDSDGRTKIHAAAVLGCNMVNYLWMLSKQTADAAGLDFEMLRPLLEVTLAKTQQAEPKACMTGPARRGDISTIKSHLNVLDPEAGKVYKFLSEQILNIFHPELIDKI